MLRRAWIAVSLGALCAISGCTLTLGFDGLAGEKKDAGTELECAAPKNAYKDACNVVAGIEPGWKGTGFTLDWKQLPDKEVAGGFVSGNELVLAVHINGDEGIVLSVDLDSGNRTLRAGNVIDANEIPRTAGKGSALEELRAIRMKAPGTWVAHLWPNPARFEGSLYEIDAATGDRGSGTLLFQDCTGFEAGFYPRGTHSLIDSSGAAVWIAYHSDKDDGVVRVSASDCNFFPTPGIRPAELAEFDGKIWVLDLAGNALSYLDPLLGNLTPVSIGHTLGSGGLLVTASWAWTIDPEVALSYTRIDKNSGDPVPLADVSGPAALQVQHPPFAWLHPKQNKLVLALDGAIVILDPTDGGSSIFSY